jgi:ribosome-associated translation inhibitor RaiA
MKRFIELKHIGPKGHVRHLIEDLMDRLEDKLAHFDADAVSVHAVFEENGTHKLARTSVTCHVPRHVVAAHEEGREGGATIRRAFEEVERQLEKCNAIIRSEYLRRRSKRRESALREAASSVRA